VSVAVTEALKEHVPLVGGQTWDTLTHPLVGLGVDGRLRCVRGTNRNKERWFEGSSACEWRDLCEGWSSCGKNHSCGAANSLLYP